MALISQCVGVQCIVLFISWARAAVLMTHVFASCWFDVMGKAGVSSPPPPDPGASGPVDQGVGVQDRRERLQRGTLGGTGAVERPHHHPLPAGSRRPHLCLAG